MVELFTGSNGTAVVAHQTDGKIIILQDYETKKEAKEAIVIISEQLERRSVVYIPNPADIKAHIVNSEKTQYHLSDGRKQKGHGGS